MAPEGSFQVIRKILSWKKTDTKMVFMQYSEMMSDIEKSS